MPDVPLISIRDREFTSLNLDDRMAVLKIVAEAGRAARTMSTRGDWPRIWLNFYPDRLPAVKALIATIVPPNSRDCRRVRIAPSLYVLARRSRSGVVRRFFVARITTNGRAVEHGLGAASADTLEPALDRLAEILNAAYAMRRERYETRWQQRDQHANRRRLSNALKRLQRSPDFAAWHREGLMTLLAAEEEALLLFARMQQSPKCPVGASFGELAAPAEPGPATPNDASRLP